MSESTAQSQARELQKKQEAARVAELYRDVFATPKGQEVLRHIEETFGFDKAIFKPVSQGTHYAYDPLTAALNDGARGVVIFIRETLRSHTGEEKKKPKIKK